MKLLLQILWGWSVLANGAVGIQVGTVQTNNQNIKLIKMNYNNPAWLQAASNVGREQEMMTLMFSEPDQQLEITAEGKLVVQSTKGGETITSVYDNPSYQTIQFNSDANSSIILTGKVTSVNSRSRGQAIGENLTAIDITKSKSLINCTISKSKVALLDTRENANLEVLHIDETLIESIDISQNKSLKDLWCSITPLTLVDLSNNKQVDQLSMYDCGNLTTVLLGDNIFNSFLLYNLSAITNIQLIASSSTIAETTKSLITKATSVDGTVTLRQGDEFNQTIIEAAMEKGWDVQYYQ